MKMKVKIIGFIRRCAEKLRDHPLFSSSTLATSAVGIGVAIVCLIIGVSVSTLLSESTNVIVAEEADTSRREIVSAIETSGADVKDTIETSNDSLGSRIVSELGEKIETSGADIKDTIETTSADIKDAIETSGADVKDTIETSNAELRNSVETSGNQIVSAILSLGNNPSQVSEPSNLPLEEDFDNAEDDSLKENEPASDRVDAENNTIDDSTDGENNAVSDEVIYDYLVRMLKNSDSVQIQVEGKPALNVSIVNE